VEDSTTVDRRTLVSQAWRSHRLLYLRTRVLLEAGQTYWVDLDTDSLIVEDAAVHVSRGDHRQRRPGAATAR
jgi:hypothetical protein